MGRRRRMGPGRAHQAGFTLAEVAVTLAIVSISLLWVLEGLNRAKVTAGHAHNVKIARELALGTLGEIEAGLYWEDLDDSGLQGSYAEDGYEGFSFIVVMGDEALPDRFEDDGEGTLPFDAWQYERDRQEEELDDDDEEIEEPYERVTIQVVFPEFTEEPGELILERWIPWEQVYGPDEDEVDGASPSGSSTSGSGGTGGGR